VEQPGARHPGAARRVTYVEFQAPRRTGNILVVGFAPIANSVSLAATGNTQTDS
jgi:hypothetical protein